jgi:polysaccharide deacetylase family protein (PEP-CTERM system associated)
MTTAGGQYALSIDVEDWFQVENLRKGIGRESWNTQFLRVHRNIDLMLEILARQSTIATFFVLGWIAEHAPSVVRHITAQGHEVACHGYGHQLLYDLTPDEFRCDIRRAKALLEDLVGRAVIGYRAPSFSITDWSLEILIDEGFKYDSSLFPVIMHDRYGKLGFGRSDVGPIREIRPGFYEVLLSCYSFLSANIPWAGGGYFRAIPYPVFCRGIRRIIADSGLYCFYIHPWELDPRQPRVTGIGRFHRIRHYINLAKTEERFERLLRDFRFGPVKCVLPEAFA